MTGAVKSLAVVVCLVCLAVLPSFSQAEEPSPHLGFSMGLGIGVQTFNGTDEPGTWQSLSLTPDISFGKLGVGLDLTLNYNFSGGSGSSFVVRRADWWPSGAVTLQSVAAIYLPKIAYVRWGLKGDDLFLKLGSFNDATLGDGFIMGDYNNTLFMPAERHFGLQARHLRLEAGHLRLQRVHIRPRECRIELRQDVSRMDLLALMHAD